MKSIFAALRYNLANLTRFSGRDPRGLFWPWAVFLFLMSQLVGMLAAIPLMVRMFSGAVQQAGRTQPGERVSPDQLVQEIGMGSMMQDIAVVGAVVTLVVMLLLAAAVVRRLHDTGRTGWWGLLPVPFQLIGFAFQPQLLEQAGARPTQPDPGLLMPLFINNAVYLLALAWLIFLLVRKGTPGPNRYGDAPTQAAS